MTMPLQRLSSMHALHAVASGISRVNEVSSSAHDVPDAELDVETALEADAVPVVAVDVEPVPPPEVPVAASSMTTDPPQPKSTASKAQRNHRSMDVRLSRLVARAKPCATLAGSGREGHSTT